MADIELVVKLPEETYEYWKIHKAEAELLVVTNAVINGTPLEKHDEEVIKKNG